MLIGMLATVAWWLGLAAIFGGVGGAVLRLFGRRAASAEDALSAFWIGWAAVVAVLQVAHVFVPIGPAALGVTAAVGALGLAASHREIGAALGALRHAATARPLPALLVAAAVGLFLLWLADRAMAPITPPGDSGFYHIGAVRWLQAEPLLPGLGNVDGRFGFNNALFLYMAMLDGPAGPPHFHHLGMPLLFLVFVAESLLHARRLFAEEAFPAGRHLLGALFLASVVPFFFVEFSSTSTDTANLLVGFVIGLRLFRLVFERRPGEDVAVDAGTVFALATVGVTIKLSFAFLGFFACAAAGLCFLRLRGDGLAAGLAAALRRERAVIAATVLAAAVVLGTWVARGVVMTGYFAYPSTTALRLDVDWKVPEAQVVGEADAIKVWARYPFETDASWDEILAGWDWLGPWFWKTLERADVFTVPMLLFVVGAVVYVVRARRESLDPGAALLFLGPPAIAFGLWFVTAPAERFGGAIFWLLGAGVWSALYARTGSDAWRRGIVRGARLGIPLMLVAGAIAGAVLSQGRYGWALFVPAGPEAGFHPFPEAVLERHVSRSGLVHYVAVSMKPGTSAWTPGLRCWDAPLPCTIRAKPRLEQRAPDDVRAGFRLAPAP